MQTHSEFSEKPIVLKTDRQTYRYIVLSPAKSRVNLLLLWITEAYLKRYWRGYAQSRQTDRQTKNFQIYIVLRYSIMIPPFLIKI